MAETYSKLTGRNIFKFELILITDNYSMNKTLMWV